MADQTIIDYGSVTLRRCMTIDFRQDQVLDDLSQTDLMYSKFTIRVIGYVHGFSEWCTLQRPFNPLSKSSDVHSASQQLIGMRVNLPPRKTFAMRIGATTVNTTALNSTGGYLAVYAEPYPSSPPTETLLSHLDVNNGPRCTSFLVKRVVADNVFQVEAEFEICKVECNGSSEVKASGKEEVSIAPEVSGGVPSNKDGVLSNRWGVIDDIDANLKTVRTYRGRLRTASITITPNNFRWVVIPPLCAGMRREEIQFSVSPDGLCLDYLIKDVEVMVSAPYPAKKWTIEHTESITQANQVHTSVDVTLSADRETSKGDLITIGLNVVWAKIVQNADNVAGKVMLEMLSVTDHIGDDQAVSISARGRRLPGKVKNGNNDDPWEPWSLGSKLIGRPLRVIDVYRKGITDQDNNWDGNQSYGGLETTHDGDKPYYQGPIQLIGAFLPFLQTPCDDNHKITTGEAQPDGNGEVSRTSDATVSAQVDNGWTDDDLPLISASEADNMYVLWKMESVYKDHSMKLALPIANTSYGGGDANRVVTLSQPQSRRVVRAEAERIGAWPEMPSPAQLAYIVGSTSGLVQTYLGMKRRFATPFYTAGGQRAYRVSVEFFFSLNKTPGASDTLAIGRTMWTTDGNQVTAAAATNGWS